MKKIFLNRESLDILVNKVDKKINFSENSYKYYNCSRVLLGYYNFLGSEESSECIKIIKLFYFLQNIIRNSNNLHPILNFFLLSPEKPIISHFFYYPPQESN